MSTEVEGHQGVLDEGLDATVPDVAPTVGTIEDGAADATDKDKLENNDVGGNLAGQLKEPPCQIFYAVRKCDSLKAPAVFFSFDDANFFVEMENEKVECKEFNVILDAMEYLYQNVGTPPGKEFTASIEPASQEVTAGGDEIMDTDNAAEPSKLDNDAEEINPSSGTNESTTAPEIIPTGLNWTQPVPIIPLLQQPTEPGRPTSPTLPGQAKTAKSPPNRQSAQRTQDKKTNAPSGSASASSPSTKKRARSRTAQEEESPTKRPRKKETKIVRMFDEKFELLKQYKEQYGTCDVPFNNKNTAGSKYEDLGKWVRSMRVKIKSALDNPDDPNALDKRKVKRLLDLGFVMTPHRWAKPHTSIQKTETTWDSMFEELKKFKETNGHLNVPHRPSTALRSWVVKQRRDYEKLREGKKSALTGQNMARLTEIGFQFTTFQRMTFEGRVDQYIKYKEKHGAEPKRLSEDGLGKWVCSMRQKYALLTEGKPTNLTQEQADRLTSLGFKWSSGQKKPERNGTPNKSWDTRLQELYAFKQQHGTTSVPQHYPELGNWVHKQRTEYKKFLKGQSSIITPERFSKLTEAGFVFEAKKRRGKRGLPGLEGTPGSRAAGKPNTNTNSNNNTTGYDSDGSSSHGEGRSGGGTGFEQQGHQAVHNNFRNFAFDPRTAQNQFSPWDRYPNANSAPRQV